MCRTRSLGSSLLTNEWHRVAFLRAGFEYRTFRTGSSKVYSKCETHFGLLTHTVPRTDYVCFAKVTLARAVRGSYE